MIESLEKKKKNLMVTVSSAFHLNDESVVGGEWTNEYYGNINLTRGTNKHKILIWMAFIPSDPIYLL